MEKTENKKKNRALYLLLGVLSTAACIFMIMFMSQFFWITLPLVFTSFALAADYL
ncbi:MAG: hypothetical protein ACK4IY_01205 [Chitinophagales bacterium]